MTNLLKSLWWDEYPLLNFNHRINAGAGWGHFLPTIAPSKFSMLYLTFSFDHGRGKMIQCCIVKRFLAALEL